MNGRGRGCGACAVVATILFIACSPFGSSDDGATAKTPASDSGTTSSSGATEAGTDAGPDAPAPLGPTSCASAPVNLFCDDFSSQSWAAWKYPGDVNPKLQDAPNAKVHFDSVGNAPASPVATFEFPEPAGTTVDPSGTCGYAWSRHQIDLTGAPIDKVTVSFDMRLVATDPSDKKESVALVIVKDSADLTIENYIMVRDPKAATIFEQWSESSTAKEAAHAVGDLSQGNWVRVELTVDAPNHAAGVVLDGVDKSGSLWNLGPKTFGSKIAKVVIGIGYPCTEVGGAVDFDNVIVTQN